MTDATASPGEVDPEVWDPKRFPEHQYEDEQGDRWVLDQGRMMFDDLPYRAQRLRDAFEFRADSPGERVREMETIARVDAALSEHRPLLALEARIGRDHMEELERRKAAAGPHEARWHYTPDEQEWLRRKAEEGR